MLETTFVKSQFGTFKVVGSELGLQSVKLTETVPDSIPATVHLQSVVAQLEEYFAGRRRHFEVEFDWGDATEFNKSVWQELLKIEYGHTTSYLAIAHQLNNPKAVRAVGMANRNNPIAIIVPCHRVIASNGDLQGYFYGLDMKRALLELENPMSFAQQGSLF
ncbi:MAG: methylated-DNA--[protein]-cysteine S-methyltransferase [Bacteroidota bacterium]